MPFLGVQPDEGLHATIVRLPPMVRDLNDEGIALMRTHATGAGRAFGPITIRFGAPHITADSLHVSAAGDQRWDGLIALIREAGAQIPGVDGNMYPPPWAPHMTIAYATAAGDDEQIRQSLAATPDATAELGPLTFTSIAWCAAHQNRDVGTYTFEVLFGTPLGEDDPC